MASRDGVIIRANNARNRYVDVIQRLSRIREGISDHAQFWGAFVRRPTAVGALAPSSRALAFAMVNNCDLQNAQTVVELGPGTGAFTGEILSHVDSSATFFALELSANLTHLLRRRFPTLTVYNDSAENLQKYLSEHQRSKADVILSGLPWASLPLSVQERVLSAVTEALEPGGEFLTFGYVHARKFPNAIKFRQRLEGMFSSVDPLKIVWRNIPPAFIYRCIR